MYEYQIHFGRQFYQAKKTGYWQSSQHPPIRAHRWVWECTHGPIPKGYHVHHKDHNPSNNDISNLELICKHRHASIHASSKENIERLKKASKIGLENAKAWHRSPEGREWHRKQIYMHTPWFKDNRPLIPFRCSRCKAEFTSKSDQDGPRFCSPKCKTLYRYHSKVDHVERTCVKCGKPFIVNKNLKTERCSVGCIRRGESKYESPEALKLAVAEQKKAYRERQRLKIQQQQLAS